MPLCQKHDVDPAHGFKVQLMVKLDTSPITVVGVYPVESNEPVWLIEVELSVAFDTIDWGSITQPVANLDPSNWQVVYDEQVSEPGDSGKLRAVFFFHYLRLSDPLRSAYGDLPLPPESPRPARLSHIQYDEP